MTRTWTAPDLLPEELDALRQILEGEYRPWCRDRPNARDEPAEAKAKTMKPTPLFDQEAA